MAVIITSDTHGSLSAWRQLLSLCPGATEIVHAGDVLYHGPRNPLPAGYEPGQLAAAIQGLNRPFHWVRGNCDADVDLQVLGLQAPPQIELMLAGLVTTVSHGHQPFDTLEPARKAYRMLISGHTHIPVLERQGQTILLNPGSPALPKGNFPPTVAILADSKIRLLSLPDGVVVSELRI